MRVQKFKLKILTIFLLGLISVSALYKDENQVSLDNDENYTSIDRSNNLDLPLLSNVSISEQNSLIIDNQSFDFSSQESVTRMFSKQNLTEGNSTPSDIYAPSDYTLANVSVSLDAIGEGFEQLIIENESVTYTDRIEMFAQSFSITSEVWISAIYLPISSKGDITPNITILRESHEGEELHRYNTTLSDGGWTNIVNDPLILEPGQYFVVMEVLDGEAEPQFSHWMHSDDNSTLTLFQDINIGSWEIADYDMGLIIDTIGYIEDISAIDINVNEQEYIMENDLWTLDFTQIIENDHVILNFTSNISQLVYTYNISCTYFRFTPLIPNIEIAQNEIHFNFTLDLLEPELDYQDYQVIVNQIYLDYFYIEILNNGSIINYQRISPEEIVFFEWGEPLELKFVSLNAIEQIDVIHTNHVGDLTNINVSTEYSGNITWLIYENDLLIHSQTNETNGFLSLDWELTPPLNSQNLNFQILFYGENHAGWEEEEIAIIQRTNITASPITAYVFDEIVLECEYWEIFSNDSVEDATITYDLEGFSSLLIQNELNQYQNTLELDPYNFGPGIYEITYTASCDGYDPQSFKAELQILSRPINFEIIQNGNDFKAGEELRLTVHLEDILGVNQLLDPVDVKISLYAESPQSAYSTAQNQTIDYLIYTETAENVESNHTFLIPMEIDFEAGIYTLSVEILSDTYNGIYIQNNFIEILEPTNNYLYFLFIGPVIGTSVILFVINRKRQARKSIAGIMIMHENGVLIANKIEANFTDKDPLLISGAMSGMIMLIKEITGGGIKTIEIDEGYVSIVRGEKYWLVLFLRNNPVWIQSSIRNCVKQISNEVGSDIMSYSGMPIPISLDSLTLKYFHKIIEDEYIEAIPSDEVIETEPLNEAISEKMAIEAQSITDSTNTTSSDLNVSENDTKNPSEKK